MVLSENQKIHKGKKKTINGTLSYFRLAERSFSLGGSGSHVERWRQLLDSGSQSVVQKQQHQQLEIALNCYK